MARSSQTSMMHEKNCIVAAGKLAEIEDNILQNLVCSLKSQSSKLVFGKGNPCADIFFIGEAPGATEEKLGVPFVGAAGKQLDKLLQSISLTMDDCYIANILKYRPPNNRPPQVDEIRRHTPYLLQQILAIKPRVIITLGNFSTKFVLAGFTVDNMKSIPGISEIHGQVQKVSTAGKEFTVIALYHPAACLYNPPLRKTLEEDFQKIAKFLRS